MRRFEIDDECVPPVYRPLLLDETPYIILYGSRGSAKSKSAFRKLVLRAFKNEYFKCIYSIKEATKIRETLYAGLNQAIDDLGLNWAFKSYDSDYRIKCINGNLFIPIGVDEGKDAQEKLKAIDEASHLLIDEANKLSFQEYTTLDNCIRTKKTRTQVCLMFNPVMETHWLRTFFFHPDNRHMPNPSFGEVISNPDERIIRTEKLCVLRTTLWDNNFIDRQEYYEKLLRNAAGNKNSIRVNIEGDWGLEENNMPWLHAFNEEAHVKDTLPIFKGFPIYLSFDFNRSPVTCVAMQMSESMGTRNSFIHFVKEFGGEMQLNELCRRIRSYFPNHVLHVTGDRTGKSGDVGFEQRHMTYYSMIGRYLKVHTKMFDIEGKNLEHNDSRELCNTMLYNYDNIYFSKEGCPNLINDCLIAQVDEESQRPGVLNKDRKLFKMDYLDCGRYMMQTYFLSYARKVYLSK